MKKIFLLLQVIAFLFFQNIFLQFQITYSQDILSAGLAPKIDNPISPLVQYPVEGVQYYNSRAFGYNAYGSVVALGPFRMFLNSPSFTNLMVDPQSTNFISGGSFASDGYWYGTRYGLNNLNRIDTSTGAITVVGSIGASATGLAFDWTTNTMYCMTYGTASQLNTVNLSTGALTPIGTAQTVLVIDIACSNSGQLYGVEITNDNFVSINKTTGVLIVVGPLGASANYAQGMSWDHSTDSCYWASYTTLGELRRINKTTGMSTLLFATNCEIDGFAIPGAPGPQITHTPLPNTENLTGPYVVNCVITPAGSPIFTSFTKLFWSRNSTNITDSVQMTNTSGNNWTGNIPGNGTSATYRYYIRTADQLGRLAVSPGGAPGNLHLFNAAPDLIKPVITHIPLPSIPKTQWPATVTATITDNIGIDSGWVRWFKYSAPGTIKHFKLINTAGNTFQAPFNSTQSEITYGDSICYRIIAQDNSSNHNKDSTQIYGFKILSFDVPCVGTDSVEIGYPFYTFYMDSRTDMLYLASEIGSFYPPNINRIGFYVKTAAPQVMSGFKIRMQNTTSTSISTFTTTGWTDVYDGTLSISNPGWFVINLQTSFYYTGQNLLIDICFNNSSYTANSIIKGTPATGRVVHNHSDLASGDGCTHITSPGSGYTALPNICFNIVTGTNNSQVTIPETYKLSQNYPNPFNPKTIITYQLPVSSIVKLMIYDVLGREIQQFVNEKQNAGTYNIEWDGSNYPSGVYFYSLTTENFSQTRKMVLIK